MAPPRCAQCPTLSPPTVVPPLNTAAVSDITWRQTYCSAIKCKGWQRKASGSGKNVVGRARQRIVHSTRWYNYT